MTTRLETLRAKLAKRKQADVENFWKLADAIARGEDVDVAQLEAVLVGADTTPQDLKQAVELLSERMRLKELINSEPTLRRECEDADDQIRRADAELERAERRHEDTVVRLKIKLSDLHEKLYQVALARERLVETCPDEALRTRFEEAQAALRNVRERLGKHKSQIDFWSRDQQSLSSRARCFERMPGSEPQVNECLKRIEEREEQIKVARKQISTLEKQAAQLEQELNAIWEQMMKD
jgi:hypothetical protein